MLDPEACYRALAAHDRRFDGRFYTAVTTTGVYCRPVCRAPLPKPRNVRFFACAAAAEEAGFRPCRRCRPEAAPGSPAWAGTSATVTRALRLIESGALDGGGVESFAARLGVSSRYLRRLFAEQLGASPHSVALTRRVHLARRLIDETPLPMTEVALAAGFTSVRRFNHAIRSTYRGSPTALRRGRAPLDGDGWELRLPARSPLDGARMLGFLGERAIPGVEAVEGDTYRRTFSLGETRGALAVRVVAGEPFVILRVHVDRPCPLLPIIERVSRMFDLGTDSEDIAAHLARDPALARVLKGRKDVRVVGAWDPFELAVRAILGQQVSVRGARTLAGRLAQAFGSRVEGVSAPALGFLFPVPESLAESRLDGIGIPGARALAIRSLAAAVASRALDFASLGGLEEAVERLTALPGFGEWTAQYVAMRALGEPDAFPAGDLGVRRALARGGRLPSLREARARAERWRPWRAYAVMALWTRPSERRRS